MILTFGAVVFGYLCGSLPGVELNPIDFAFVNSVRRIFRLSSLKRPETQQIATKDNHKVLESFVLALSDQQLVTGLAVLLAGFSRCDISLYSFSMVFNMAWFACTTHLYSLTVLKR